MICFSNNPQVHHDQVRQKSRRKVQWITGGQ